VDDNLPADDLSTSRWASRRRDLKSRAVSPSHEDWVKLSLPVAGRSLPLLVEPNLKGVDLFAWVKAHRELVDRKLLEHGGLLFRGFGLKGSAAFEEFLRVLDLPMMYYTEGATPRSKVSDKVYTSTEFPSDQTIAPHNELNYVKTWPMKIWFFCVTAAQEGGETPIVDVRKVFDRLDPKIRQPFVDKGWMLVRNFGDGFGLTWKQSYRVETRQQLEDYFRQADIQWEWGADDHLRSSQVRPAIARHLVSGETVWFNHIAFWHVSSLERSIRDLLLKDYGEAGLPYNTYYGDGSRIEDSVAAALRDAYEQETVSLPWQEGDLMMLDNMLVAHGRKPFQGARLTLAAMAEPCSNRNLPD
jgi:alpha-ketoglutarate-dependent taurine dioxygenase